MLASAAADFYESAGQATRNDANRVRLGIGWGLWETVNRIRVASARQFGNMTIEATDVLCAEQYNEQLRNGSLDVVFGRPYFDPAMHRAVPLYQERMLAVLSEDSPLASRKTVSIGISPAKPLLLYDRHMPAVPVRQGPRRLRQGGRDAEDGPDARGRPVQPGRA